MTGTWTKVSDKVSGRTPFAKEETQIDYEHDSEAEWEPEGEGEDIQSGDEDDDEPAANIDPEDAGWLVPEGYLSEGEGVDEDVSSRPAARPAKKVGHVRMSIQCAHFPYPSVCYCTSHYRWT